MPDKICDAAQVGAVRVWLLDLTISGAISGRCVETIIVIVIIIFVLFQNHNIVLICIVSYAYLVISTDRYQSVIHSFDHYS